MFFSSLMHCHAPRNLSEWLSNLSPTNKKPFGALRFHPMHPGSRWRERSWLHIYREGRRLECALLQRLIGLPSFLLGTPNGLSCCWASLRADMALPRPNKLAYFLRRLFSRSTCEPVRMSWSLSSLTPGCACSFPRKGESYLPLLPQKSCSLLIIMWDSYKGPDELLRKVG